MSKRPLLPKELPSLGQLTLKNLQSDNGIPYTPLLLTTFKHYRSSCKLVRDLKKDHQQIISHLQEHKDLYTWNIVVEDQAWKLSHLVLVLLAKFESFLQTKILKMPQPRGKRITANPTTDAEMITDLRIQQWKSAQVMKAERRKIAEPNSQSRVDYLIIKTWQQQDVGNGKNTGDAAC